MEQLTLTQEWDKTFPRSDKVDHRKVTFTNRFGITLAADLYLPKGGEALKVNGEKLAAIAVCGPFGAVKEQSSGLYAQHMAERGFVALAFDPSFTGESGGEPRRVSSPDLNTEDYGAAVDYLATRNFIDPDRIGIIGICGWGGIAINEAALDTRVKATVVSTMYDLTRVAARGYFDEQDKAASRQQMRRMLNEQRTKDYAEGGYLRAGGVIDPLPDDAPWFVREYHAYYKCPRGYHPRSGNSTDGWNLTSNLPWMNTRLMAYAAEIESPVLIIHGERAHSRYMGETAFEQMTGTHPQGRSMTLGNKEIMIIPDATHVDLYDDAKGVIPYDKIELFFRENL